VVTLPRRSIALAGCAALAVLALGACIVRPVVALPLAFEANVGQSERGVRFIARGADHVVHVHDDGVRVGVATAGGGVAAFGIRLVGARAAMPQPRAPLAGKVHYLRAADPEDQLVDVPAFDGIVFAGVHPGIDVVYHGEGGAFEYDVVVAPHADPRRVALRFDGAALPAIAADGSLRLRVGEREVAFRRPVAFQVVDGARRIVEARYAVARDGRVTFVVGRYDRRRPLVIDPVLELATNLWGNGGGVALDPAGNIYVVGSVWTGGLPAAGGYATQPVGTQDAYVIKLNPAGTAAIYATYLGARRATTTGLSIAVDAAGSAYVTGTTSAGYPITPGAYQSSGPTFITKLTPAGNALAYSTLFAAPVAALAVHADTTLALTGTAASLTTTPGAFQPSKVAAKAPYVARLNATGTAMVYATWLGGAAADEAHAIAVDGSGNAYVVGTARSSDFPVRNALRPALNGASDAFVAKLSGTGTQLVYGTYLGGSGDERAFGVAVDAAGRAGVVGWTKSFDFPVTPGVFQPAMGGTLAGLSNAYIAWLDASGGALLWSSYLGGGWCAGSCFGLFGADEGIDVATSVAVDAAGFTYVGGYATSARFPLVDAPQTSGLGGDVQRVPFVARIRPGGSRLVYSSVFGTPTSTSTLGQIAVDAQGGVVAVGNVPGAPFPITGKAVLGPGNAFVLKLANAGISTMLRSSSNPASRSQPVTLYADANAARPGGTVTFMDGTSVLGAAAVADGAASLVVSLAPGVHRITAVNSADGKVSPPLFQVVSGQ